LTAVAVWDHQPTADELLERRLQDGWQPTKSCVLFGPKILGHAARLESEKGTARPDAAGVR
jgi:hypothetical protein